MPFQGLTSHSITLFSTRALRVAALLAIVVGALSAAPNARAAAGPLCYVNRKATGSNNGNTWTHAYKNLQSALNDSNCEEIWVAKGVYKPGTIEADSFNVAPSVEVYGGFVGTETKRSQRNPGKNLTVLSGDIDNNDFNSDGNHINELASQIIGNNSLHVVYMDGTGSSVVDSSTVLDGFVITGGRADGSAATDDEAGGGLNCYAQSTGGVCSPTLRNLTFSGNSATRGGALFNNAGISSTTSSPFVSRSTFRGNSAAYGGAVYNEAIGGVSSPIFGNVTFSGNSATSLGGAVYNNAEIGGTSSPSFVNVTFSGNSATTGGGMYNSAMTVPIASTSNPALTGVIMWDDTATSGPEIANSFASPSIDHSDIEGSGGSGAWVSSFGTNGGGNYDSDPKLAVLGNYGGFTKTMPLMAGSAALNRGNNVLCDSLPVGAMDQRGVKRPQGASCDMGATESHVHQVTFRSDGSQDGWVLESTEISSVGGSHNASGTLRVGDDGSDRQFRSILSFNTASLPGNADVRSATLKIKRAGLVGADPYSILGSFTSAINHPRFGSTAALGNDDFSSVGGVGFNTILNAPVSGWYSTVSTNSGDLAHVNLSGLTQFRLYFTIDDNDDGGADYFKFHGGEAADSDRPKLIVQYYTP